MDSAHGIDEIYRRFAVLAEAAAPRAPLYVSLAQRLAHDPHIAELLLHAPPNHREPVLLLACVHWLLLREPDDPAGRRLARHFPNLAPADDDATGDDATDGDPGTATDPWPAFRSFCDAHRDRLAALIATRTTQTNEVGRCAIFLPAMAAVETERGSLSHLDLGASAGLNLLADRYRYRYTDDQNGSERHLGDPSSRVLIRCSTRGPVQLPTRYPVVIDRLGLDRRPIDVHDRAETDWLRACVWPDQADRFERLSAAIVMARRDPPEVLPGDLVGDLPDALDRLDPAGHPLLTTSWVLSYLHPDERRSFLAALDRAGRRDDLTWCAAESPRRTPELPWPDAIVRSDLTEVLRVDWRDGRRTVLHVGTAHPHGYWLHGR